MSTATKQSSLGFDVEVNFGVAGVPEVTFIDSTIRSSTGFDGDVVEDLRSDLVLDW